MAQVERANVIATEPLHESRQRFGLRRRHKHQNLLIEERICVHCNPAGPRAFQQSKREAAAVFVIDEQRRSYGSTCQHDQVRLTGKCETGKARHLNLAEPGRKPAS